MNLKLIVTVIAVLVSTSAVAARVESEDAQSYGSQANKARVVIGAATIVEGNRCDFGESVVVGTSRLSLA